MRNNMKTAKTTHGKDSPVSKKPSYGAYAHLATSYQHHPGDGPVVQNWPASSGTPKRTGNIGKMKRGGGKGGY